VVDYCPRGFSSLHGISIPRTGALQGLTETVFFVAAGQRGTESRGPSGIRCTFVNSITWSSSPCTGHENQKLADGILLASIGYAQAMRSTQYPSDSAKGRVKGRPSDSSSSGELWLSSKEITRREGEEREGFSLRKRAVVIFSGGWFEEGPRSY